MQKRVLEQIRDLEDRVDRAAAAAGCSEAVRQAPLMKTVEALAAVERAAEAVAAEVGLKSVWPFHAKASLGVREGTLSEAEAVALVKSAR